MLQRLDIVQWSDLVPVAAFAFTASIFVLVVWRAVRMKKHRADALASMPLEDEPAAASVPARKSQPTP